MSLPPPFLLPPSLEMNTEVVFAGDRRQGQPVGAGGRDAVAVLPAETREHATRQVGLPKTL